MFAIVICTAPWASEPGGYRRYINIHIIIVINKVKHILKKRLHLFQYAHEPSHERQSLADTGAI